LRHRVVDIEGPVHYIDFGGGGEPLLMVHGLAGSALNWMEVGPGFATDHHAVALDLSGFGETPLFDRSATVGAYAELVRRFIEKVFERPVTLMGNSMGGHITVVVAAGHPALVDAAVLVDPAVPGVHVRRPEPSMLAVMAALSVPGLAFNVLERRARALGAEELVRQTLALVTTDVSRLSDEVVEAHLRQTREREHLGAQNSRAFVQATRSIGLRMANPRFWHTARRVRAPVLVVHGEVDRVIPVAAARELVHRVPGWKLKVLEGVGHVPMMEAPAMFMRVVRDWLADRIAPTPATTP
jgi:pimeloyl-ACP methyl ester carboxylesterase